MKTCIKCKKEKKVDAFYSSTNKCKDCYKSYTSDYQKKNRANINAKRNLYRKSLGKKQQKKEYEYKIKRDFGLYYVWYGMRLRCVSKNYKSYPDYGGRGIKILWESYQHFKRDMYDSYLEHLKEFGKKQTTIDRIDVDGNYCKENCRWATWSVQNKNKRKKPIVLRD